VTPAATLARDIISLKTPSVCILRISRSNLRDWQRWLRISAPIFVRISLFLICTVAAVAGRRTRRYYHTRASACCDRFVERVSIPFTVIIIGEDASYSKLAPFLACSGCHKRRRPRILKTGTECGRGFGNLVVARSRRILCHVMLQTIVR
jgi:hypothetical protein